MPERIVSLHEKKNQGIHPDIIRFALNFIQYYGSESKPDDLCYVEDIVSRILRGNKPKDFRFLTADERRKIAFFSDDTLTHDFIGQDINGVLRRIAYSENFITSLQANNTQFKLLVTHPTAIDEILPATWGNLISICQKSGFEDTEALEFAGIFFPGNNSETILQGGKQFRTVWDQLANYTGINNLFRGDGFILDPITPEIRLHREYITLNREINTLPCILLPLLY